ncbi:YqzL family protein [Halobacillus sp. Marseille-Q1614]|nr:YqzL family protein [Halobacillus sp. Marseille-Q1614]
MLDVTWNVFRQTGNIETYLLMKELEGSSELEEPATSATEETDTMS